MASIGWVRVAMGVVLYGVVRLEAFMTVAKGG